MCAHREPAYGREPWRCGSGECAGSGTACPGLRESESSARSCDHPASLPPDDRGRAGLRSGHVGLHRGVANPESGHMNKFFGLIIAIAIVLGPLPSAGLAAAGSPASAPVPAPGVDPPAGLDAVAISPDGKLVAAGSADGQIHIWDEATGALLRTLPGHASAATAVAFAPDGKSLASAGRDSVIRLWDVGSGQQIRQFDGHEQPALSLAFSSDGASLASGGEDTRILIWNTAGGLRTVLRGHLDSVSAVAFSADGRTLRERQRRRSHQAVGPRFGNGSRDAARARRTRDRRVDQPGWAIDRQHRRGRHRQSVGRRIGRAAAADARREPQPWGGIQPGREHDCQRRRQSYRALERRDRAAYPDPGRAPGPGYRRRVPQRR